MPFKAQVGNLRIPSNPSGLLSGSIWRCWDSSGSYVGSTFVFLYKLSGKWVVSKDIGCSYKVDGSVLPVVNEWMNGYCFFNGSNWRLWYSRVEGWALTKTPPGFEPYETWVYTNPANTSLWGSYTGDDWYSLGAGNPLPTFTSPSDAVFRGRGSNGGTERNYSACDTKTVSLSFEYWMRAAETGDNCGVYVYQGEGKNNITVGLHQYKNASGVVYIRSLEKVASNYTYGTESSGIIKFDNTQGKWILGTYGAATGWYEGTEPSISTPVVFIFQVPEGLEITAPNIIITFDKCVIGDNTETQYGFSVGRWHG